MQLKTLKQNQKTQTTFGSQLASFQSFTDCLMGEFRYFHWRRRERGRERGHWPDLSIHIRTNFLTPDHRTCGLVGIAINTTSFRKAKKYISIVNGVYTSFADRERIVVYDGSERVVFPKGSDRQAGTMKKSVSGAKFSLTRNASASNYNLRVAIKGIGLTLRISEKNGTLSLGVVKWPEESDEECGLVQTYDDQNCSILKERVPEKEQSLFKDLGGALDFTEFHYPTDMNPSSDNCTSFAFPGLKVLGRKAVETARAQKR